MKKGDWSKLYNTRSTHLVFVGIFLHTVRVVLHGLIVGIFLHFVVGIVLQK